MAKGWIVSSRRNDTNPPTGERDCFESADRATRDARARGNRGDTHVSVKAPDGSGYTSR